MVGLIVGLGGTWWWDLWWDLKQVRGSGGSWNTRTKRRLTVSDRMTDVRRESLEGGTKRPQLILGVRVHF